MGKYIVFLWLIVTAISCHDVKIGYLETENAVYVPDSLIVDLGWTVENYVRWENESDWVSTGIQGVLGTAPITYRIIDVKVDGEGDAEAMKAACKINGGGIFIVPFHHKIPKGIYIMSIEISNGDYHYIKDDIFRIIVREVPETEDSEE